MNIKLIIGVVVIFLGTIIATTVWYVLSRPDTVPQTSETPTTLPIGDFVSPTSSATGTSSQGMQKTALVIQDGSTVVANDFIRNGVTIPDTQNIGRYLLAGNFEYCVSDPQQCQAGSARSFNIFYNSVPQSFTIALTDEPIGQARLEMEQSLLAMLGITEQQMCSLNYYVGVTVYVNSQFAGKNLGFSFCPGATVLPK